MKEVHSHWNWAPGSGFLNNSEFSLTWQQLAWNALPFFGLNYRTCLADTPDCPHCDSGFRRNGQAHLLLQASSSVLRSCRGVDGPHQTQAARAARLWNGDLQSFFHCDLILFIRHQLRVKIRCDRKCLDRITFDRRWVHSVSQVVWKGATLESSFPPLLVHGDNRPGPSGPHPE